MDISNLNTHQQQQSSNLSQNASSLPAEETELITQFKRDLKVLRYPVLLKNTNISIRSLQQFFYEYQPNKNLSLKLTNLYQDPVLDILVMQILPNQHHHAASLNQDLLCKQIIEIYKLINIGNKHIYVKDPYTLSNYIFSNGFYVSDIVYLQQQYLSNLTNNYQIQLINALHNLHQIQDILLFNQKSLYEVINLMETIQVVRSNSKYGGIQKVQIQEHLLISSFFADHFDKMSIGRYKIEGMCVIFTDYDLNIMKQILSKLDNIYEYQSYNLTATLEETNRKLYLIRANNIYNTIAHKYIDKLSIQFDLNTILFLLQLQLEYKYLVQVEFLAFDITVFIDLLQTIQIPTNQEFIFKHRHPINPILTKAKKIKRK